jgi:aryl-alcohol dehydrogenase-like predicted oxidoreductase
MVELKFLAQQANTRLFTNSFSALPYAGNHLVLGTAQLGYWYGVANSLGKPDRVTANKMLCAACVGGIRHFDTAQAYGNSESVLGDFFSGTACFSDARFVTKLHPDVDITNWGDIRRQVEGSLRRLKCDCLWALLLHRESQFEALAGSLGGHLRRLREAGLVKNLGVSVYSVDAFRKAVQDPELAIVEVSMNVFDRRVKRAGLLEFADAKKKMLMIRSVFLQGLALMDPADIPARVPNGREATSAFAEFCHKYNLDRREFAYDYVHTCCPNSLIVMGADSPEQVYQNCVLQYRPFLDKGLIEAWDHVWPEDFEVLCDPSKWTHLRPSILRGETFT